MDRKTLEYFYKTILSPVGPLTIVSSEAAIKAIIIDDREGEWRAKFPGLRADEAGGFVRVAAEQLGEYFRGQRISFEMPIDPDGTAFQRKVWKALLSIDYGETASYGEIARLIENPGSVRAVGQANKRNPIPIIIPCHRVVGRNGALTGYAPGIEKKKILLSLESK